MGKLYSMGSIIMQANSFPINFLKAMFNFPPIITYNNICTFAYQTLDNFINFNIKIDFFLL